MKKKSYESTKFLCDYLPIMVFFAYYNLSKSPDRIINATICLVTTTLISLFACYLLTKKIPVIALVSGAILTFFGGLTILLKDDTFIKIKPTIINSLFSAILFYGYFKKKIFLSYLLGEKLKISDEAWIILSLRWAIFFAFLATLNEFIWRNFSTDFWVQFKVMGMLPITFLFMMSQLPFIKKELETQIQK